MNSKDIAKKGGNRLIVITLVILFLILTVLLVQKNLMTTKQIIEIEEEIIDKNNHKEFEIWVTKGGLADVVEEVLEKYTRRYPQIKFSVKEFDEDLYNKAILEAAATNSLPQMFYTWGDKDLSDYVKLGIVEDITVLADARNLSEVMVDNALDGYTINNRIYGLPMFGWNTVLYCNKNIFERFEIEYPTNYEEFLDVMVEIKGKGGTPITISKQDIWTVSLYYMSLALAEGDVSSNINACNDIENFNNTEFLEAAKKLEEITKLNLWNDDYELLNSDESLKCFTNTKAAMMLNGSWVSSIIDEGYTIIQPDNVKVIRFPSSNSKDEAVAGYSDGFVIANDNNMDEKINKLMCMEIMKDISDQAVLNRGLGIPVYKTQSLEDRGRSVLNQCYEIFPKQGYHSAFDKLLESDNKDIYNAALEELVMGRLNYKEFISKISQSN